MDEYLNTDHFEAVPPCRGDQGFLNSYFYGFAEAPMFDPRRDYGGGSAPSVLRLPTRYNADLGLYIINGNKWGLPAADIRCTD